MRLIDADKLKDMLEPYRFAIVGFEGILALIDNVPDVEAVPDEHIKDAFETGYKMAEIKLRRRPQSDLTDEVWKLYKKHQSHLATHVLEFGEELADLLSKYNEGGAE